LWVAASACMCVCTGAAAVVVGARCLAFAACLQAVLLVLLLIASPSKNVVADFIACANLMSYYENNNWEALAAGFVMREWEADCGARLAVLLSDGDAPPASLPALPAV
jgi:hypothetical protein